MLRVPKVSAIGKRPNLCLKPRLIREASMLRHSAWYRIATVATKCSSKLIITRYHFRVELPLALNNI